MNPAVMGRPRTLVVVVSVAAVVVGLASPAFAQRGDRETGRLFVSIAGFSTIDRFANDTQFLLRGNTIGAGVGVGAFLARRWSVEFDAAIPRRITSGVSVYSPPPPPASGVNYVGEARTQTWHTIDMGAILLAFHPSHRGRVRMAYGAGVAFVRLRLETDQDATYHQGGNAIPVHTSLRRSDLLLAPVFQIEASVRLNRRIALVPHLQASAFTSEMYYPGVVGSAVGGPGVFVFRPGVSLRAHF